MTSLATLTPLQWCGVLLIALVFVGIIVGSWVVMGLRLGAIVWGTSIALTGLLLVGALLLDGALR